MIADWPLVISSKICNVARQNFVRFTKSLNGNAKSSDFRSEEEDKLKTFLLPLVFQEGPCEGITGGTSCSIGEAKGGVKT